MIKYELAPDIKEKISEIIKKLNFLHIDIENLICIRSIGSASKHILARCHALSRIWQKALGKDAVYIIEVVSENYDKLSEKEKIKTLIHELLHIPKSFGGGFKHHSAFSNIEKLYKKFIGL